MNDKGQLVTFVSLKTRLVIVAIIMGVLIALYLYIAYLSGAIRIPKSCPEGVIPDRIDYQNYTNCIKQCSNSGCSWNACKLYWADGLEITLTGCQKGALEGENINYIYCKPAGKLNYYKKSINSDGTIGKDIILKISFVLNPQDSNSTGYKVISAKCS